MTITPKALAERAGTSISYTRRLCRQGKLLASKPGGRDWLIDDEEAEQWLREREKALKTP